MLHYQVCTVLAIYALFVATRCNNYSIHLQYGTLHCVYDSVKFTHSTIIICMCCTHCAVHCDDSWSLFVTETRATLSYDPAPGSNKERWWASSITYNYALHVSHSLVTNACTYMYLQDICSINYQLNNSQTLFRKFYGI